RGARKRRDEPVAAARQCLDEPRIVRIVTKGRAQPLRGGVQAVFEVDKRAVRPEAAGKFFAGHHIAWMLQHQAKDFEGLLLETDPVLPLSQLTGAHIQLERFEAEETFGVHTELS